MKITKKQINKFLSNNNFGVLDSKIKKLPQASFLFVTFNRCPHSNFRKNPLVWSFQTLLANKICKINDFVVIDDNSTDYTRQSIKWIEKNYNIKINYKKN